MAKMNEKEIKELEKELNVPKIPKMDLSIFLKLQKENPKYRIGVLNEDISSFSTYKKGDIVLFTPYLAEECYGRMLFTEMQRHAKLCTIEIPSERFYKKKSNIPTTKTMVGVPLSLIAYEIII